MNRLFGATAVAVLLTAAVSFAQEGGVPYPDGYRNWYHVKSRVNLVGTEPEAAVGMHHVYANEKAHEGLKSGKFADGSILVLDRFKYVEGDDKSISEGDRKVLAVILKDTAKYNETGGWGFEGFKAGDPNHRVVKDGGKACFACHIPFEAQGFVISKPHK